MTDAHDEVLFITIHHVQETWMSLIIHELETALHRLADGNLAPPMKMLSRVSRAQEQMGNAWEVLKTMTPTEYLEFRVSLGRASGFQSWQCRTIEFLLGNRQRFLIRAFAGEPRTSGAADGHHRSAVSLRHAIGALVRQGLLDQTELRTAFDTPPVSNEKVRDAWLAILRDSAAYWDLYYLAEKLVDVEDNFRRWRFNHLITVERIIRHKTGTGGATGVG